MTGDPRDNELLIGEISVGSSMAMAYISASNGSLQPAFLAVMVLLLLLSTLSVLLRVYCRAFLIHKVGPDDYLIVAGLAITIAMGVMNGFHVSMGTG